MINEGRERGTEERKDAEGREGLQEGLGRAESDEDREDRVLEVREVSLGCRREERVMTAGNK